MKLLNFVLSALTSIAGATEDPFSQVALAPGGGSPSFYLVASSPSPSINNPAPINLSANLTGNYAVVEFHFSIAGKFSVVDPTTHKTYNPIINSLPSGPGGSCSPGGALAFIPGETSNKCAKNKGWGTKEESSLASQLAFGNVGGFYACHSTQSVYYEVNANEQPADCVAITLYTVPVVV